MTTLQHPEHIDHVVDAIQQRWGVKALRRMERVAAHTGGLPTGIAALDRLLGADGLPRGALTCLSGDLTSGKTTLALDALARAQADGEVTVVIDMTGALDPEYAERRGIDLARLLIVWPQPPALGLDIAHDIVTSGGAGLIVLDLGGGEGSGPLDGVTRTLRHLSAAARRTPYALLGLVATAPGRLGAALLRRADGHLRVERQRWLCDEGGVSGYEIRVTALKARFGPPGQHITLPLALDERRPER